MKDLYTSISEWVKNNEHDPDCKWDIDSFKRNDSYFKRKSDENIDWHCCNICCKPQCADTAEYKRLREEGLCFHCDFWTKKPYGKEGKFIIKSVFYGDGGKKPLGTPYLGFAGREFLILDHLHGRLVYTNNLWCAGDIPKRFGKEDTAEFLRGMSSDEAWDFAQALYKGDLCQQGLDYFNRQLRFRKNEKERKQQQPKQDLECPF